jgi:hypothetical protein
VAEERVERRLAAILCADVVEYSRLMGVDDEKTLAVLKSHRRELIDPLIDQHRGRIFKTTGDGMLIEFASVVDAVRCAVVVNRALIPTAVRWSLSEELFYEASVISEAFWLSEVGALRSSANDMIRLSEVITSERFGPVGSKYREFADDIHKCALYFVEIIIHQIHDASNNSKNDLYRRLMHDSPVRLNVVYKTGTQR